VIYKVYLLHRINLEIVYLNKGTGSRKLASAQGRVRSGQEGVNEPSLIGRGRQFFLHVINEGVILGYRR